MTIDHCYWEHDHKYHCAKQVEKEALKSYSQKQGKASTSGPATVFKNKVNLSLAASFAKTSSSKSSLSPIPKKQSNSLQVDLSSKLASNGKLISDKCKKHLENNLCLYCGAGDHNLNPCFKKQTTVTPKGHSTSITADNLAATSKKPSKK